MFFSSMHTQLAIPAQRVTGPAKSRMQKSRSMNEGGEERGEEGDTGARGKRREVKDRPE